MSKLSKWIKSDTGQSLLPLALQIAASRSRKAERVIGIAETALPIIQAVKHTDGRQTVDVLAGTIYAAQNKEVSMPETSITPVKAGTSTSSFKLTGIALVLIPVVPVILQWLQQYVGTLPQNSVTAVVLGIVLTVGQYLYTRYKTTDGERQATAKVAEAQAVVAIASGPAPVAAEEIDLTPVETPADSE